MPREGIYLREDDEFVGPFQSRGDAERFLELMNAFGADPVGIEIVEFSDSGPAASPEVTSSERRGLSRRIGRSRNQKGKAAEKGEDIGGTRGRKGKS